MSESLNKYLLISVFLISLILFPFSTVTAQNDDVIELKERYLGIEWETGYILEERAHSLGFGLGMVQNQHLDFGLSLHFMINDLIHPVQNGTEEFRKLNLLGLDSQYRGMISKKAGYFAALSLNLGTAELNRVTEFDVIPYTGFTAAVKPGMGIFYRFQRKFRLYLSGKYMYGLIFQGMKSFQGTPMLSLGVRFTEISF